MPIDHLAEIDQLLTDITEVFGVSITLVSTTAGAYSPSAGSRTVTTTSQSVAANRLTARQVQVAAGGGEGHSIMEERQYEVQASLVSIGTPAPGWRITDGGANLDVLTADLDADRRNWIITARRTR